MHAITLLKNDHRTVSALFKEFEQAGPRKQKAKRKIVDRIIKELSAHAAIEEQVFYPAARRLVGDTEDDVLEALEEHHLVKLTLTELEKMAPSEERFDAKVKVLIECVRHHVEEEETELFPKLSKHIARKQFEEIGAALAKAKTSAPTRPHPAAPDTPPANLVAGLGTAAVDRVRDKASEAAHAVVAKVTSAARQVRQRATGRPAARPARGKPRGTDASA